MDLWIRSQDREILMQISRVDYSSGHVVVYQPGDDVEILVGTYESKERTLEVLDEIQNAILGIISEEDIEEQGRKPYTGSVCCSKLTKNIVYEMPKE